MTVLQEIYGYAFPAILASGPVLQEIGKTNFPAIIAFVTTLQETDEVLFLKVRLYDSFAGNTSSG